MVTDDEVLSFMAANPKLRQAEAIDKLAPGLPDRERMLLENRLRTKRWRLRQAAKSEEPTTPDDAPGQLDPLDPQSGDDPLDADDSADADSSPAGTARSTGEPGRNSVSAPRVEGYPSSESARPTPVTRTAGPTPTPGEEDRLAFLRRQLIALEADIVQARKDGQLRLVPQLSKRLSEAREEFDREWERERRVVRLKRTPAAISVELAKRAEAIALRAEMHRRRAEREQAAKKRASKAEEAG